MIAFLGGSFDPIHEGHIHLAKTLLKRYDFEKLYFVPAQKNPLKEPTAAPSDMRLKMLNAALNEIAEPRFEILDLELRRDTPSFTLLTLKELERRGEKNIALILGNEVFERLVDWHEPKKILESAHCVVVTRNAEKPWDPVQLLENLHIADARFIDENKVTHTANSRWIELVKINPLPYSATQIRKELKDRWKKNDLENLPQGIQRSVWLLIKENHLYTRY